MQRVTQMIRVAAPVDRVYRMWRDFASFPEFMSNVKEVRVTGLDGQGSHWVLKGPMGTDLEYDAELTENEPNRSIGWRSVEGTGNIQTSGAVTFRELGGEETEINVVLQWSDAPAGPVGE